MLDASSALTLLAAACDRNLRIRAASQSNDFWPLGYVNLGLTEWALCLAGVPGTVLKDAAGIGIRDLWRDNRLPLEMTFGAVLVLHRAQVATDRGLPWAAAYLEAWQAALELVAGSRAGDQQATTRRCRPLVPARRRRR